MGMEVVRSSEGLVKPCKETPTETVLELSGMDKVPVLRCNARTLHVYKHRDDDDDQKKKTLKAFDVIREAVSKALVPYYPLAGRLVDYSSVQCSAKGVWLVDAYADCTLRDALKYLDDHFHQMQLLPRQSPHSDHPLVQMQVTQFLCGGFVIGLIFSHTICDGLGAAQFMNAVGEMARGVPSLTVEPVWRRDFFVADYPPINIPEEDVDMDIDMLEQAKVEIPMEEIDKAKGLMKHETGVTCSTFELVAAALWRCRTRALLLDDVDKVTAACGNKLVFFANCRKLVDPPLPRGFYGNCFFPVTVTADVANSRLSDVVKVIQKAKAGLADEFANYRLRLRTMESNPFMQDHALYVSEWGRLGFNDVDMGWGPPEQVVPIQGSPLIPAAIVGSHRAAAIVTLNTWCVRRPHLQNFLQCLSQLFNPK